MFPLGKCMDIKCLVFDCDGVILDSVPVKTNAFGRLAEPYGAEARDRFVMYHMRHGGVSRYRKFAWFFQEVLGREITPEESEQWGRDFVRFSLDEVRKCALIPGVLETLRKWHGRLKLYVCSGAPGGEVRDVLTERKLAGFFDGIFGSPPAKDKLLQQIVDKEAQALPEQAVMVGDASTDRYAAESVGALFYGVGPELRGGSFAWSEDLRPFNKWLESHLESGHRG